MTTSNTSYTWAVRRTRILTLVLLALGCFLLIVGWNMAALIPANIPAVTTDLPFNLQDVWYRDFVVVLPGFGTQIVTILIYAVLWSFYTRAMSGELKFLGVLRSFKSAQRNDSPGLLFMGGVVVISWFILNVPFTAFPNYMGLLFMKTGCFILSSMAWAVVLNIAIGVRSFPALIEFFNDPDSSNEVWAILFSMVLGLAIISRLF